MEYKILAIGSSAHPSSFINSKRYLNFLKYKSKPLVVQTPASKKSLDSEKFDAHPICFHNGNILLFAEWNTCRELLVEITRGFEEALNSFWCSEVIIMIKVAYYSKIKTKQLIQFVKDFLNTDLVSAQHLSEPHNEIELIFGIDNGNNKGHSTYYTSLSALLLILRFWDVLFGKDSYIDIDDVIKRCIDYAIKGYSDAWGGDYSDNEYWDEESNINMLFCLWLILYHLDINFLSFLFSRKDELEIDGPVTLIEKIDDIKSTIKYMAQVRREKFVELTRGPSKNFISKLRKESPNIAKRLEEIFITSK